MTITDRTLQHYFDCNYKAHLALKGEIGSPHAYETLMDQLVTEYRPRAMATFLQRSQGQSASTISCPSPTDLRQGPPVILDCTLVHEPFQCRCEALKRIDGKSPLGSHHYVPVMFRHGEHVHEQDRLLLSFAGLVLEALQGRRPEKGILVYGAACQITTVNLGKYDARLSKFLDVLIQIDKGALKPRLRLNKHCAVCEFRDRCKAEAVDKDDLSLLRRISDAEIERQHGKGIFTVTQLSHTFRPRRRPKHLKDRALPYYPSLQALALREKRIYVSTPLTVPSATTNIYVDMEGNSSGSFVYLIGALVARGNEQEFHHFWADSAEAEAGMFSDFYCWLAGREEARLLHYGSYETKALQRTARMVSVPAVKKVITERTTNVLSLIYAHVYFPIYSNSLKDIGAFLGCRWTDATPSGVESIVWRTEWERTKDTQVKNRLIRYNYEDCLALATVANTLTEICNEKRATVMDGREIQSADTEPVLDKRDFGRWGQRTFATDSFRLVSDCAYFDYQRSKIYIRTDPLVRKALRHARSRQAPKIRPNRIVDVKATKCWRCRSTDISRNTSRYHVKRQLDLRMSASGIRRFVTEYRTPYHWCGRCRTPVFPPSYKSKKGFGSTLVAWAMYQHVVNHIPFEGLSLTTKECFGMYIPTPTFHGFKSIAAQRYKRTYNEILRSMIAGHLIHADETRVKLRQTTGYVWVFANMDSVIYLYRPTREGAFLHDLLAGFNGVLVSDFYTAYDSVPCQQQKCLVHLMWDINADLLKNPFDEELKLLGGALGELSRTIISTVDRFGLKARYLKKHKEDVEVFYGVIANGVESSAIAEHYRDRLVKYKGKLFTFLDHDGIPWNNNNAEHAVKPFAKYRRLVKRSLHVSGLENYLVLLSIWQTCEHRGISFFDFLLSGKRDIDRYCEAL